MLIATSAYDQAPVIFESGYGGTSYFDQEIALEVDGRWYPNFTVNLNAKKIL